jgi:hypothetical protein
MASSLNYYLEQVVLAWHNAHESEREEFASEMFEFLEGKGYSPKIPQEMLDEFADNISNLVDTKKDQKFDVYIGFLREYLNGSFPLDENVVGTKRIKHCVRLAKYTTEMAYENY